MDGSKNEPTVSNAGSPERAEKQKPRRFIGSFCHSLDSKGRLVIPQGFRDKLGETFCVAPSFDFRSIAIYPTEKWEERNETYERLGKLNPALNRYLLTSRHAMHREECFYRPISGRKFFMKKETWRSPVQTTMCV